jgi:hypothetical protein
VRAILALLLLSAPVAAEERIDASDVCADRVAALELQVAQLRQALVQAQLLAKYRIAEGDKVDPKTFQITRAKPRGSK